MLTVYVTYGAVMAILAVAAIWCAVMNRRHPGPPSRLGQALEADRLDRMAAERREEQPCNLAWPPAPKPATGHVWRITAGQQRCGCVLTTTPDGVRIDTCPAHDPAFVSEWERRLSL